MTLEEKQAREKERFVFIVRTLTLIALAIISLVYSDGGIFSTILEKLEEAGTIV